jgi:tetratricopeptide (TPR) repeat protein
MFTDIVGYTRRMGFNEADAMDLVRKNRALQLPLIDKHHGTLIKEMGDGTMARFSSALDAVRCAIEIQSATANHLDAQIRAGIHLGDITIENGDIFGDGVNIASRLESAAEPGAIYISDAVHNAVRSSGEIHCVDKGHLRLKNVVDPVRTYAISSQEAAELARQSKRRATNNKYLMAGTIAVLLLALLAYWVLGPIPVAKGKPTLAVLPFQSSEEAGDDEYLSQGLKQELIHSLGQVRSVAVINTLSTQRYLGSVFPVADAKEDLVGVDYFVRCAFEKNDLQMSFNVEVVDRNEKVVMAEQYASDITHVPELFGQISMDISQSIEVPVSSDEKERLLEIADVNPDVYELWLKGITSVARYNEPDFARGLAYFEQAVEEHPGDARAWAGLAEGLVNLGHSPAPPPDAWPKARAAAIRAIQLDSTLAEAWGSLAHVKTYFEWDYEGAEAAYHKANSLNPSMAMNHYHYAWHLRLFGRLNEAIVEHKLAQKLDPFNPLHTAWLARLLIDNGQLDEARTEIEKSFEYVPENPLGYLIQGDYYSVVGRPDSAILAYKMAAERLPPLKYLGLCGYYSRTGEVDKALDCAEEIKSIPINSFTALMIGRIYGDIDSLDQFFEFTNYRPAHCWLPWIRVTVGNQNVVQDPRFKDLMDEMNLPMPTTNP